MLAVCEVFGAQPWQIETQWTDEQYVLAVDALLDRNETFDAQSGDKPQEVGLSDFLSFWRN